MAVAAGVRVGVVRLWAVEVALLRVVRLRLRAERCTAAGNGCAVCPAGVRAPGPLPPDADADVHADANADVDADDASAVAEDAAAVASDDDADDAAPAAEAASAAVVVAGGVRDVRGDVARVCATVAAERSCCCCCCCCLDHQFGIRLR